MQFSINTKTKGKVTFSIPSEKSGYVFCDLNGQPGTLGWQLCRGGHLMGSTISYHGDYDGFTRLCRNWWKAYRKD